MLVCKLKPLFTSLQIPKFKSCNFKRHSKHQHDCCNLKLCETQTLPAWTRQIPATQVVIARQMFKSQVLFNGTTNGHVKGQKKRQKAQSLTMKPKARQQEPIA